MNANELIDMQMNKLSMSYQSEDYLCGFEDGATWFSQQNIQNFEKDIRHAISCYFDDSTIYGNELADRIIAILRKESKK